MLEIVRRIGKSLAVEPKTKTKNIYDVRRQVCGIKRALHPQIPGQHDVDIHLHTLSN